MQASQEQALAATQLLAGTYHCVLSTHSQEFDGYPFGSVVPYALGLDGFPITLLSHLSQHTKNLDQNPKCALTIVAETEGDVQQRPRLCVVGDMTAAHDDTEASAARYFRYFPQARMYYEQLGFRFYCLRPERFHWNGGFATARWFGQDRVVRANPLTAEQEAGIIAHMNTDHVDALAHYAITAQLKTDPEQPMSLVGVDACGMDLRQNEQLFRIPLLREISTPDEVRTVLIEMATASR